MRIKTKKRRKFQWKQLYTMNLNNAGIKWAAKNYFIFSNIRHFYLRLILLCLLILLSKETNTKKPKISFLFTVVILWIPGHQIRKRNPPPVNISSKWCCVVGVLDMFSRKALQPWKSCVLIKSMKPWRSEIKHDGAFGVWKIHFNDIQTTSEDSIEVGGTHVRGLFWLA